MALVRVCGTFGVKAKTTDYFHAANTLREAHHINLLFTYSGLKQKIHN